MNNEIEITALSYGGRGVGRLDGKVVLVPFTAIGDVVEVELTEEKKSFSAGVVKKIVTPSPVRIEPECPLFARCGGCHLQHIDYEAELKSKGDIFVETLERIGGQGAFEADPPVAAPSRYGYRYRARFHVEGSKWGFYEAASKTVVDLEHCPILASEVAETFTELKARFKDQELGIEWVEIALGQRDRKTVVTFAARRPGRMALKETIREIECLKGIVIAPRRRGDKRLTAGETEVFCDVGDVKLSAPGGSFIQVNPVQNQRLIEKVKEFGAFTGKEAVLDLFCGSGNLSVPIGMVTGSMTGVESDEFATKFARANATKNKVFDSVFISADVPRWLGGKGLKTLASRRPNVVILDPPRGGDRAAAKELAKIGPGLIEYVSCSPPTLARDLSILSDAGYELKGAVVVDLFPATYHIESVVSLVRS